MSENDRLLIAGYPGVEHVGRHLADAATELGLQVEICDVALASTGSAILRRVNWAIDRRPPRLAAFSREVVEAVREFRPRWLISTGFAPIGSDALAAIGDLAVIRLNFLTDDPWSAVQRSRWFDAALPHYDRVFSPRRGNLEQLEGAGCKSVAYLPFGYSPAVHFPEAADPAESGLYEADVVFVGGADAERVKWVRPLLRAGMRVRLYGQYWDRFTDTRPHARGYVSPSVLRKAVCSARVSICLVRKANRDGHTMRTYETAATGAAMIVEETPDHQALFGPPGETVLYASSPEDMVEKAQALLPDEPQRLQLAVSARQLITTGGNTYRHRLANMLT